MKQMSSVAQLMSLYMTPWVTLDSLERGSDDPSNGGLVRSEEQYTKLDDAIQYNNTELNSCKTVYQLSKETGISVAYCYTYYRKKPDCWIWKSGLKGETVFVQTEGVRSRFAGNLEEGYYDGLSWSCCLKLVAQMMRGQSAFFLFRDRRVSDFIALLRLNLFQVKIQEFTTHVQLKVVRGIT